VIGRLLRLLTSVLPGGGEPHPEPTDTHLDPTGEIEAYRIDEARDRLRSTIPPLNDE
jgi:hypothetical protein